MKKFITLIALIMVAMIGYSQNNLVRTVDFPSNGTYAYINGVAADTLVDAGQDTIDYVFEYHNGYSVDKIALCFQVDTVKGHDNGVVYSLYGKEFENDPIWTAIIAQDTTADVAGVNQNYAAKLATIASDKSFLHYRVRLFMEATSGAGEKMKIDKVELKTYQK